MTSLDQVFELLNGSYRDVVDAIAGFSEAEASSRPTPEKWSPLECLEHVVFVEGVYLGWLKNAALLEEARRDERREMWITSHVADRSWEWQAPDVAVPKGRYQTVAAGLADFEAARSSTIVAARELEPKLLVLQARHSKLGLLNGIELLLLASGHASRHAQQIREARTALSHCVDETAQC